jgi:hypothetical protein
MSSDNEDGEEEDDKGEDNSGFLFGTLADW